ncbi:MAG: DNA methyltransferase [Thermoguttaceae bacterium]|jgi:SAM-dependent methyltransferase
MSSPVQPDFCGVPLDTRTIPQDSLNIDNKKRSNLFPWNGQFSPQLIEAFLQTYARPGSHILDPFLGSGTTLHEAGRCGFSAFGCEINPAAFKMACIYRFINVKPAMRRRAIERVDELLDKMMPEASPLFAPPREGNDQPLKETLASYASSAADPCVRQLLEALIVLLNVDEKGICERAVSASWGKLRRVVSSLPFSEAPIELTNCDARSLPVPTARVGLVITSPPYINVFNYHQQYRKSAELLGWDLLEVARSEIGSNRKHRQNRFLTVIQYCVDMLLVFQELRRVCKPDARVIVVVGRESNVRKTRFFNGEIVASLAVRCASFGLSIRQERVFQNRFGEKIYEDILHFLPLSSSGAITRPTEVAREVLTAAIQRAPAESLDDLRDALQRIDEVEPSPLYTPSAVPAWQVV